MAPRQTDGSSGALQIDGRALAERIKDDLKSCLRKYMQCVAEGAGAGFPRPRLAGVLVGDSPGAGLYCRRQERACEDVGVAYDLVRLPADATSDQVAGEIDRLAADRGTTGIILQMPLPEGLSAARLVARIPPEKDVEGVTAANLGRLMFYEGADLVPCTAAAAYELAKHGWHKVHGPDADLRGAECVVVGHSPIVGKPLACLLTNALATCTVCHVGTRDLAAHTRRAELLIVAVGKAGLITAEHVRPGAVVVDVGINRVDATDEAGRPVLDEKGRPKKRTVGDVDFDAVSRVAAAITPVPGGVGPVTCATLLRNTLRAAVGPGAGA